MHRKEKYYHLLETYRLLHHFTVDQFIDLCNSCSTTTYYRMKKNYEAVTYDIFENLLNTLGFRTFDSGKGIIESCVKQLHEALCFYRQDECKLLCSKICDILKQNTNDLSSAILYIFFSQFYQYFHQMLYLDKKQVYLFIKIRNIFSKEINDLIQFYCLHSSTKCNKQIAYNLYHKYPDLIESDFPYIISHAISIDFNFGNFDQGIIKSMKLKEIAESTNNTVALFEYYDGMITYYIRCQPDKVEKTMKKLAELVETPNFPFNKKLQFYKNYGNYCIYQKDFDKAYQLYRKRLQFQKEYHIPITSEFYLVYYFLQDLLHILEPNNMIILSKDTFPIKADYYYYIYLKEKKMMNYNQKIRFLKNKVLKLLGKDGNMTKYMVILELESLHLKGQTNELLKSLIKP